MPRLRLHSHVFFGGIAVRCYKHRARWTYDERDVRAAGQVLADLAGGLDDVVDVQLPAYRAIPERDPEEWYRPGWRRTLMSWMVERARVKLVQENRPHEDWVGWRAIGGNGLPGDLTWEEFAAFSSQARHLQNVAGTRPLQLLAWNGETWLLPRACAELLDRWEQREGELVDQARLCRCGARGPYWGGWRRSIRTGYVTVCPRCAGESGQLYTGHLRGVLYDAHRRRGTGADDCLCRLCQQSPAAAGTTATSTAASVARCVAAATPVKEQGSPAASSASKARRCISWNAVAGSSEGPCRAGSTPPSSARAWDRPSGRVAALASPTSASWRTPTVCAGSSWGAADGTPAGGRRTWRRPRQPRSCRLSLTRPSPHRKACLLPARPRGDRYPAASLNTASRA